MKPCCCYGENLSVLISIFFLMQFTRSLVIYTGYQAHGETYTYLTFWSCSAIGIDISSIMTEMRFNMSFLVMSCLWHQCWHQCCQGNHYIPYINKIKIRSNMTFLSCDTTAIVIGITQCHWHQCQCHICVQHHKLHHYTFLHWDQHHVIQTALLMAP